MKKPVENTPYGKIMILAAIVISDLILAFYLKYNSNDVSLNTFKINYFGNIINIAVNFGLLLIFILYTLVNNKSHFLRNIRTILFFSIIYLIPLLLLGYLFSSDFSFPEIFILEYPLEKIVVAGLYVTNTLIKLFLALLIFGMILHSGKILFFRSLLYLIIGTIIFASAALLFSIKTQSNYKEVEQGKKYDVAVVLGAAVWNKDEPSTLFRGRINKALELYRKGAVSKIQLTGGNAPGELSEAMTAKKYLSGFNVPEEDILVEEVTGTTSEQVRFIKNELINKSSFEKIIIVSDEFHLARVNEMCSFFRVNAATISSDYSLNWEKLVYYRVRDSIGLLLFWLYAI